MSKLHYLVSSIDSDGPTGACIVVQDESGLIGSLGLRLGGPGAFINSIFVREDARNKGVATKMICKAVDLSRENGKRVIGLYVNNQNTGAQQLYRRLGFLAYDNGAEGYTEYVRVVIPPDPL